MQFLTFINLKTNIIRGRTGSWDRAGETGSPRLRRRMTAPPVGRPQVSACACPLQPGVYSQPEIVEQFSEKETKFVFLIRRFNINRKINMSFSAKYFV